MAVYLHPADLGCDDPHLQNTRHRHRHHGVLYRETEATLVSHTADSISRSAASLQLPNSVSPTHDITLTANATKQPTQC